MGLDPPQPPLRSGVAASSSARRPAVSWRGPPGLLRVRRPRLVAREDFPATSGQLAPGARAARDTAAPPGRRRFGCPCRRSAVDEEMASSPNASSARAEKVASVASTSTLDANEPSRGGRALAAHLAFSDGVARPTRAGANDYISATLASPETYPATSKLRTSRLQVVTRWTSLERTTRQTSCGSTTGLPPEIGRSRAGLHANGARSRIPFRFDAPRRANVLRPRSEVRPWRSMRPLTANLGLSPTMVVADDPLAARRPQP